jgi:hypothetical protein
MWELHGRRCARRLAAALVLALGWAGSAVAGVTYDFAFRTTDVLGNAIAGGAVSGGGHTFSFSSAAAAQGCDPLTGAGCAVIDVLLVTTDPLVEAGVSVSFDASNGVTAAFAAEWSGQGINHPMLGNPTIVFAPLNGLSCTSTACGSFDGALPPPNGPPSLPPGTYDIGTIVWDTTAASGPGALMTAILAGDGTFGVVNGNVVDLTGSEVLATGALAIVPEPGTAALLGLGLAVLVGRARRRRP